MAEFHFYHYICIPNQMAHQDIEPFTSEKGVDWI